LFTADALDVSDMTSNGRGEFARRVAVIAFEARRSFSESKTASRQQYATSLDASREGVQ